MFRRIDHIALHVRDISRSVAFYEGVLGFEKYAEHTVSAPSVRAIVYLKLGDTVLELTHMPEAEPMKGFHFCLEAENLDQAMEHMRNKGARVLQPPHSTHAREPREEGWRRVVFEGPEGEEVELRG
jgi:lactoylglutathione lyase